MNIFFMKVRDFLFSNKKSVLMIGLTILLTVILTITCLTIFQSNDLSGNTRVIYSLDQRQNDQEIIKLIDNAEEYAYFAIYYFTQKNIGEALMRAKSRGVDVKGITDHIATEGANKEVVNNLRSAGVPVVTQKHLDGIMHLKVLVTDKAYASGSYNWTGAATESNDEVLEIGTDPSIHKQYLNIVKRVLSDNDGEDSAVGEMVKIDYTEALQYVGKYAQVRGTIVKVYKSSSDTIFIDYCKISSKCPFSIVIFASDADKFKEISKLQGKQITVTGIIKVYKGKAEIIVNSKEQITEI
ncbi:MAG: phospholipase D-like domain-containing protein [Candidatus Paceibacterota bacterium]|jgi:hypothetical protein